MAVLITVAVVLAVLAVIPIRIYAQYHMQLRVWVNVLFVNIPVFPRKPKEPKKAETQKEEKPPIDEKISPKEEKQEQVKEEKEKKPQQEKKKEIENKKPKPEKKQKEPKEPSEHSEESEESMSLPEKLTLYLKKAEEIIGLGRKVVRRLIKIERLDVSVTIGADEADKTAILTGMLWSIGYGIIALTDKLIKIERQSFKVTPVYDKVTFSAEADCILRTNLANIIGAAAIVGIAYVRYKIKNRRKKK